MEMHSARQAIEQVVSTLFDPRGTSGVAVGVLVSGQSGFVGYGAFGAGREIPDRNTLFEIASVTKVFTAALLAILATEGAVSLEDRVCDLLPELAEFPPEITLLRLATHTAGLPLMPSDIWRSILRNRRNPYAAYSTADLLRYLSQFKVKGRVPAGQIRHSNLGMALLGHILARVCGATYEQAITGKICGPLEMADTAITLTAAQQERLAPPHSARGKPGHNWDLPAFAGAGGLRSTVDDLLKFLAVHLDQRPSALAATLQACHAVQAETFAPPGRLQELATTLFQKGKGDEYRRLGIGLGWIVGRLPSGGEMLWHQGSTGGYRAFVGLVKSSGTGVIVLANNGPGIADLLTSHTSTSEIGFQILERLNSAT